MRMRLALPQRSDEAEGPGRFRAATPTAGRPQVGDLHAAATDALRAVESVSRRMEDLARELNCLGYFDDDDTPRAA